MSDQSGAPRSKGYTSFLQRPDAVYYLIVLTTAALSCLGLVMVLSASSVISLEQSGSTYSIFIRQLIFFFISLFVLFVAMRWKESNWEKFTRSALILSLGALCLPHVPGIKLTVNGNTNWIHIGGFTMQPSEFSKFGLIIWGAAQLKRYEETIIQKTPLRHISFLLGGIVPALVLIYWGGDLGTTTIILGTTAGMLFLSGLPIRHFLVIGGVAVGTVGILVAVQPYRLHRFTALINPFAPGVYKLAGWQPAHSVMGLASGGLFGEGLGASRQKWGNLSEAHTDFIFSVLGDELGLIGTIVVICLYAALIYAIYRTAMNTRDLFDRYACAGIATWLLMQVLINVGSAIGVLPVVGVTLPFISYGGSSLIANFLGIGFVLHVARKEPAIKSSLSVARANKRAKKVKMAKEGEKGQAK
jgi:cell division protein FtsW